MPYVSCGSCELRYYTAAAFTTRGHCPSCGVPARGRARSRGLDDAAFAALYDDRAEALLAFFMERVSPDDVAVALWAETLANALSIRHRFRGGSRRQQTSWLEAIAYRQLARFRAHGEVEPVSLRRLDLRSPDEQPDDVVDAFRALLVPERRAQPARDAGGGR